MRGASRLAILALPLAGLAAVWGMSARTYHQGTEWDVPVAGYDPRDILRGHYVEFEYDWPGYGRAAWGSIKTLCLEGSAPQIVRVREAQPGAACAHPVRANPANVYGPDGTARGRLYVGQERAAALEQALRRRDQLAIVTIRSREDGSFTPLAIRLRALTAAEQAARAAANQRAGELPPPPAIPAE
jgi:hypothetical protein